MTQEIRPANRQIIEEAAEWFVALNEERPDESTRARFDAWLRASPEHVREYLRIVPLWEAGAPVGRFGDDPQALVAWARAEGNVVPLDPRGDAGMRSRASPAEPDPSRVWRAGVPRVAASIVLLCVAVMAGIWALSGPGATVYQTGTGERRLVSLPDGSRVEMNSRSRLEVRMTDAERSIELSSGQALFQVARDPSRPFVVHSGDTRIRALGTQFDVYRKRTGTVVTVLEGSVAVLAAAAEQVLDVPAGKAIPLVAGQQVVIARATRPLPVEADIATAIAWTEQRLVFSRTPLTEVAEEFNRYNARQLIVDDRGAEVFRVSGVFSSTEPDSLLRFLRAQPGLEIDEGPAVVRIRR